MSIEAMKQALEALEDVQEMMNTSQWFNDRVTALRKAIEQAEKQKPVGEIVQAFDDLVAVSIPIMPPVGTKLYTAPPKREWQCLTDEEIEKEHYFPFDYRKFARAVEAKLKEKNNG